MSNTILYIDFSHLCYRSLHATINDIKEVGFGILRHTLLKNIIFSIDKFAPDKVFIACDSRKNWRKKFYEGYKAQRKEAKDKIDIDWDEFYKTIHEISDSFRIAFPFYVLKTTYLEADDIIASLIRHSKNKDDKNIVITSDGDYKQLLQYPNTQIYCPIKKAFMESLSPFDDLEIKILMGDKSDNIPSIAPRIGKKTAEKLVEGKAAFKDMTLTQLLENSEIKLNYDRNKKLIDLTKTPKELIDRMNKELAEYELATTAGMFQYFIDNGMKDLLRNVEDITKSLRRLNPGYIKPVVNSIFDEMEEKTVITEENKVAKYQRILDAARKKLEVAKDKNTSTNSSNDLF
jgi:5'-3' exonuclease